MEPVFTEDEFSSACEKCGHIVHESAAELYVVSRDVSTNLKIQCKNPYVVLNSKFLVEKNEKPNQFKKPFRVLCSSCRAPMGHIFSNSKGVRRACFKPCAIKFVRKDTGENMSAALWMKKWLEHHVITEIDVSPRDPSLLTVEENTASAKPRGGPSRPGSASHLSSPSRLGASAPKTPPSDSHHHHHHHHGGSRVELDEFSLEHHGATVRGGNAWFQHPPAAETLFPSHHHHEGASPPLDAASFPPSHLPLPQPPANGLGHFHHGMFFPRHQPTPTDGGGGGVSGVVHPGGLHTFDAPSSQPNSGPGSPIAGGHHHHHHHHHAHAPQHSNPMAFHYDSEQHARFEDNITRYRTANKSAQQAPLTTSTLAPRRELFAAPPPTSDALGTVEISGGGGSGTGVGAEIADSISPPSDQSVVETTHQLCSLSVSDGEKSPISVSSIEPLTRTSPPMTPTTSPSPLSQHPRDQKLTSYSSTVIVDSQGPILQRLIEDLTHSSVIGIDCEGMTLSREGKLCLMQIHVPRSNCTFLVDAVADAGLVSRDLKPFLESPDLLKVMHDCRQDSDALFHQLSVRLTSVFDVQVAHNVVKRQQWETHVKFDPTRPFVEFPLPAGFSKLLKIYCSVEFDEKEDTRQAMNDDNTFWAKRPLTQEMKTYAVKDVHYLTQIYYKMKAILLPEYFGIALQRSEARLDEFRENPRGGLDWMEGVSQFLEDIKEGKSPNVLNSSLSPTTPNPIEQVGFHTFSSIPLASPPPLQASPLFSVSAPNFVPSAAFRPSPAFGGPPPGRPNRKKGASTLWTPPPSDQQHWQHQPAK